MLIMIKIKSGIVWRGCRAARAMPFGLVRLCHSQCLHLVGLGWVGSVQVTFNLIRSGDKRFKYGYNRHHKSPLQIKTTDTGVLNSRHTRQTMEHSRGYKPKQNEIFLFLFPGDACCQFHFLFVDLVRLTCSRRDQLMGQ